MTPEGKIKALIKKWANSRGIFTFMPVPSAFGMTTGMSDFLGLLPNGLFLAVEAKAEGKRNTVTVNQQKFLNTITSNNGIAYVVSCQQELDELDVIVSKHL